MECVLYQVQDVSCDKVSLLDSDGNLHKIDISDIKGESYAVGETYVKGESGRLTNVQNDLEFKEVLSVNNILHYITFIDGSTCMINAFISPTDSIFLEKCLVDRSIENIKCIAALYQGQIISYKII